MTHFLAFALLLSACAPTLAAPTATAAPPTATTAFTPIPTLTEAPQPTSTPLFDLRNNNMTVAYDFTAHLCEATWMNGTQKNLPCPGDLNNTASGYVGLLSGSDQGLDPSFPLLMMFPNGGLFGRFPPFKVGPADEFRTSFTCRSGYACDMEFGLAYYDSNGKYYELFNAVHYRQGDPSNNFSFPLSALNGQTVSLVLLVRPTYQSDYNAAWGLWISPRILRP
jgi:hypothetical protein